MLALNKSRQNGPFFAAWRDPFAGIARIERAHQRNNRDHGGFHNLGLEGMTSGSS
jgi:hypothetical protein